MTKRLFRTRRVLLCTIARRNLDGKIEGPSNRMFCISLDAAESDRYSIPQLLPNRILFRLKKEAV